VWIYNGNKCEKFCGNILSLSENIVKSFRGATFFDHTVDLYSTISPVKYESEHCNGAEPS